MAFAKLKKAFSIDDVGGDLNDGGTSFPLGIHAVIAKGAEVRASKNDEKNGQVVLRLAIIDGPNKGFEGDYALNCYYGMGLDEDTDEGKKAATTRRIARKRLLQIARCVGAPENVKLQDLSVLGGKPFKIEVGLQKDPNPNKYTEIKLVFDKNGNQPWGGVTAGTSSSSSAPGGQGDNNDWEKEDAPATPSKGKDKAATTKGKKEEPKVEEESWGEDDAPQGGGSDASDDDDWK